MTLSRRWAIALGLVFALSLVANFFIGGLIVGRAVGFKQANLTSMFGGGRGLQFTLAKIARALPDDQRPILRQVMRSHRDAIESQLETVRDARQGVAAALRQEPFQEEMLDAALDQLRASNSALQEMVMSALAKAAEQLSPEGRRAMADWRHRSR